MSHKKIRMSMIGGGHRSFIGVVHRIASYMTEDYKLIGGVFDVDYEQGLQFARDMELDESRTYQDIDEFIAQENQLNVDERVEVVIIVTPNFLHYEMARKLIVAGFHVICEKPVTTTAAEAIELDELVKKNNVVFSLTHTYTGYPMVRQMKAMIADGAIGKIQKVDAQYYQGWINPFIHEKEKRAQVWRLDPKKAGKSCCMGDIGVHAFNLLEYATGLEVDRLLSDVNTLYADNPLDVDGTVLLRLKDGTKGVICASQIATGEENNIVISIYGDIGGLKWEQENPTYLTFMKEGDPAQIFKPGNPYNSEFANASTKIAPGHPEGLFDAMGNLYKGTARAIRNESLTEGAFPTIKDGVRGMKFIEAVLDSSADNNTWKEIN
ncbi:MAG: Gfo/Idh/MocA family oxidoreductase [Cyclobacteriaceae bacterium]|nr:Gfo/Idh/MocA family oxidoreductase [Cyclobacteriaceae bacterium HetDA_MAG_MS6]